MPENKKFYEKINEAIAECIRTLVDEFPELEGAAVALLYSPELGEPPSSLLICNQEDPTVACRAGKQVAKLQMVVAQGVLRHFARAEQAFGRIQQEEENGRRATPESPSETT